MASGPYWVTFEIARRPVKKPTPDHENWTLEDLRHGFWITSDHALCRESQGQYFIPSSQILLIEKRNRLSA
jgi:hypothetical protein